MFLACLSVFRHVRACVVDLVELEFQLQHALHGPLSGRHRATARLTRLSWLWWSGAFLSHQLVKHSVIRFEGVVQFGVVVFVANVHHTHEIYLDSASAYEPNDGRLQTGHCFVVVG